MVAKPLCPLYKYIIKPLDRAYYPELRYYDTNRIEFVAEEASTRELVHQDVVGMSKSDLRILRNWIFAKHGYIFKSKDLRKYFSNKSWYTPKYADVNSHLSKTERRNVQFIKCYEDN